MPPSRMSLAAPLLMFAAMCITPSRQQLYDCPAPQHLSPCSCSERSRGLDVACHQVPPLQLREVLDVLAVTRTPVWFLRVASTDLSHFPPRLFEGIDLRNLILTNVSASMVPPNAFHGDVAARVESLDLSHNCLVKIPTKAFSGLTALSALSLDYNCIETLEAHVFSDLVSLLWLSLYGNRIRLIDSRAFLGTEASLTRLNLGGNRLGQVPRYALQRLGCLQGLRLHENNVSEILVENLPTSLCDLDLSGNDIVKLDAEVFVTLSRLSALDLEGNKIQTIHEDAFNGVHDSLEWLKLGGNLLTSVPQHALRNLSRLRQLDLRANRIAALEHRDFRSFGRTLKFIFLQKNSIQTIAEGSLDVLESLEWLYLHSNGLTELNHDTFKPILDRLHVLDLHDNPYRCDCNIMWLRDWLRSKGQSVVNLPNETRCNSTLTRQPIVKLANDSVVCSSSQHPRHHPSTTTLLLLVAVLLWMCS